MNEPIAQQSPDLLEHAGHETTDASAFYVSLFALALAIAILLSLLFLYELFWRFEAVAVRADPIVSPLTGSQTPPAPRLQAEPSAELAQLRQAEDETLRSYQWIDEQQGVVQIPIERAIDLLSERGLPEPTATEPTPAIQEVAP